MLLVVRAPKGKYINFSIHESLPLSFSLLYPSARAIRIPVRIRPRLRYCRLKTIHDHSCWSSDRQGIFGTQTWSSCSIFSSTTLLSSKVLKKGDFQVATALIFVMHWLGVFSIMSTSGRNTCIRYARYLTFNQGTCRYRIYWLCYSHARWLPAASPLCLTPVVEHCHLSCRREVSNEIMTFTEETYASEECDRCHATM